MNDDLKLEKFMPHETLANILGIKSGLLREWRKKGLPFIRIGTKVFYHETEVCQWLKNQSMTFTEAP